MSSTLSTSDILARVGKVSGKEIPEYSVRSALRTLVRRKLLKEKREGREKSYTFLGTGAKAPAAAPRTRRSRAPAAPKPPVEVAAAVVEAVAVTPEAPSAGPSLPHRLAVGESLILTVGEEYVESVTNVHGRLVVERHPRAPKANP